MMQNFKCLYLKKSKLGPVTARMCHIMNKIIPSLLCTCKSSCPWEQETRVQYMTGNTKDFYPFTHKANQEQTTFIPPQWCSGYRVLTLGSKRPGLNIWSGNRNTKDFYPFTHKTKSKADNIYTASVV